MVYTVTLAVAYTITVLFMLRKLSQEKAQALNDRLKYMHSTAYTNRLEAEVKELKVEIENLKRKLVAEPIPPAEERKAKPAKHKTK